MDTQMDASRTMMATRRGAPAGKVEIAELGDRLRVTVEIAVGPDGMPSRRRALAKAWEALAAAISETKARQPPVPVSKPRKRRPGGRGTRTGSGSWWQF